VWAEWGRGKRTPAITSPLSFNLTGSVSNDESAWPEDRRTRRLCQPITRQHAAGWPKPPRSKGLALTAHIGTYVLSGVARRGRHRLRGWL
jgi:hypothetical protein